MQKIEILVTIGDQDEPLNQAQERVLLDLDQKVLPVEAVRLVMDGATEAVRRLSEPVFGQGR